MGGLNKRIDKNKERAAALEQEVLAKLSEELAVTQSEAAKVEVEVVKINIFQATATVENHLSVHPFLSAVRLCEESVQDEVQTPSSKPPGKQIGAMPSNVQQLQPRLLLRT